MSIKTILLMSLLIVVQDAKPLSAFDVQDGFNIVVSIGLAFSGIFHLVDCQDREKVAGITELVGAGLLLFQMYDIKGYRKKTNGLRQENGKMAIEIKALTDQLVKKEERKKNKFRFGFD